MHLGSFAVASMVATWWKATSSPLNSVFLATFTIFEALSIGWFLPVYNPDTVLKALVLTTFVFLGLTLFTFQVGRLIAVFAVEQLQLT